MRLYFFQFAMLPKVLSYRGGSGTATLSLDNLGGAVRATSGLGLYTPCSSVCTIRDYWTNLLLYPLCMVVCARMRLIQIVFQISLEARMGLPNIQSCQASLSLANALCFEFADQPKLINLFLTHTSCLHWRWVDKIHETHTNTSASVARSHLEC